MVKPVIVQIKRGKSIMLGALIVPIVLFGLLYFAIAVFDDDISGWLAATSLFVTLFFAALAVYFIGIALRQPVALRLDENGISGFYVTPATWDEIASVGTFEDTNRYKFLGFALHDPIAFRDRQTPWGRLRSWSTGRGFGYHIVVQELILKEAKVADLAERAETFHAARKPEPAVQ